LRAPPRLVAHLALVHDAATEILAALDRRLVGLALDRDAVLFGAATHDLGKTVHPEELTGPGTRHEAAGEGLLIRHGIEPSMARFARTHGSWDRDDGTLEDLLVALADQVWKGKRVTELESRVARVITTMTGREEWEVWSELDEVLEAITADADERLRWQGKHST
jgi:hypothetical protein